MTTFTLDVDPDAVDRAAGQVEGLRDDLESHRAGVVAAPDRMAQGWTGGAATSVRAEVTALGGHLQTFPGHLTTAATALRDLATAYRDALEVVLPALQQRWDAAEQAYADAVAASADRRAEDVAAIPADAGAQRRMWQDEAQQSHAYRVSTAAGARTGTQAAVTGDYEDLVEDLRQATRTASTTLAGAVVVPVSDETVSTYLATGQTSLGTLPPAALADLSLAQQHQVAEDLESASFRVEQDIAAGELDEAALDELHALLAYASVHHLLRDAAGEAGAVVGGAMAVTAQQVVQEGSAASAGLLSTVLARFSTRREVTTPFLDTLGAGSTYDLTATVDDYLELDGWDGQQRLDLATEVRRAIATSSRDPDFPGAAFATALVAHAAARSQEHAEDPRAGQTNDGVLLTYLLGGPGYGTDFSAAAAAELVRLDRNPPEGDLGWWVPPPPMSMSAIETTFEGYPEIQRGGINTAESAVAWDPLYAGMRLLGADGDAARQVLADHAAAEHLFADRGWADGYTAVASAGAAAAAVSPGGAERRDAAAVAAFMINGLGGREGLSPDDFTEAARLQVAETLAVHVDGAYYLSDGSLVRHPDEEGIAVLTYHHDPENAVEVAAFASPALEAMAGVAAADAEGAATLRVGLDAFHAQTISATAEAVGRTGQTGATQMLQNSVAASGAVEAFFHNAIGNELERQGHDTDEGIRRWFAAADFVTQAGSAAVGTVPGGAPVSFLASQASGPAFDALADAYATHEADAERTAQQSAEEGAQRLYLGYVTELVHHGVLTVPDHVSHTVDAQGRPLPFDELGDTGLNDLFGAVGRDYSSGEEPLITWDDLESRMFDEGENPYDSWEAEP